MRHEHLVLTIGLGHVQISSHILRGRGKPAASQTLRLRDHDLEDDSREMVLASVELVEPLCDEELVLRTAAEASMVDCRRLDERHSGADWQHCHPKCQSGLPSLEAYRSHRFLLPLALRTILGTYDTGVDVLSG